MKINPSSCFSVLVITLLLSGCSVLSHTTIVKENIYADALEYDEGYYILLRSNNSSGGEYQKCNYDDVCWVFKGPYRIYIDFYSNKELKKNILLKKVFLYLGNEIKFKHRVERDKQFAFSKFHKNYRATFRLQELLDINLKQSADFKFVVVFEVDGEEVEAEVPVNVGTKVYRSNDFIRAINSV